MPTFTRAAVDLRLTRAAVFAAVCVVLSAAGHEAASGHEVPLWALAAAWAAVLAVAAPLAGRERSLVGIAASLLGGQLALHMFFGMSQGSGMGLGMGQGHAGGHAHDMTRLNMAAAHLLCGVHGAMGTMPQGMDAERVVREAGLNPDAYTSAPASGMCGILSSSAPMLLAHLAAALVAGWVLRRGEAALWRAVRLTARAAISAFPLGAALALVRALVTGLLGAVRPRPRPAFAAEPPGFKTLLLQHCVVLRGPPSPVLAA